MDHISRFEDLESAVRSYCRDVPNLFVSARGARVWDSQAREFIDFLAGCGSLNYGHNHPVIKAALMNYLSHDGIGNALDFHTDAKLRFMRRFSDVILTPKALDYRMQFTGPTGANCVEAALKLARKHTGRGAVAAFTNAFHGMSMGALAATGSSVHRERLEGSLQNIVRLPFEGYSHAGVTELERFADMALDPSGGIEPVAAIIVETVQGEGGLNVASPRWLRTLREIASRIGAVLIVDDIQAGCGRTGQFFSFERAGIIPDIVCLSKSIGAGLPMSLLLVRPQFDTWRPGEHNGTFRGNSLAFVAGTAALELWCTPGFVSGVEERSGVLANWSRNMGSEFPALISRSKGMGMMMGVEFVSPRAAALVAERARNLGVIVERCGPSGEVIKILAPLNIEIDLFREGLSRLRASIESVATSAVAQPHAA